MIQSAVSIISVQGRLCTSPGPPTRLMTCTLTRLANIRRACFTKQNKKLYGISTCQLLDTEFLDGYSVDLTLQCKSKNTSAEVKKKG